MGTAIFLTSTGIFYQSSYFFALEKTRAVRLGSKGLYEKERALKRRRSFSKPPPPPPDRKREPPPPPPPRPSVALATFTSHLLRSVGRTQRLFRLPPSLRRPFRRRRRRSRRRREAHIYISESGGGCPFSAGGGRPEGKVSLPLLFFLSSSPRPRKAKGNEINQLTGGGGGGGGQG